MSWVVGLMCSRSVVKGLRNRKPVARSIAVESCSCSRGSGPRVKRSEYNAAMIKETALSTSANSLRKSDGGGTASLECRLCVR